LGNITSKKGNFFKNKKFDGFSENAEDILYNITWSGIIPPAYGQTFHCEEGSDESTGVDDQSGDPDRAGGNCGSGG
jgi:hypothetical protein